MQGMLEDEVFCDQDGNEACGGGEDKAKVVEGDANGKILSRYCAVLLAANSDPCEGVCDNLLHLQVWCCMWAFWTALIENRVAFF